MLARIAIPLVLYALLYIFRCWILARAERRAEQAADEPEPPAEQPPAGPPEETLLAA